MREQIRYDMKTGIRHEWWRYCCVAILILLVCLMEVSQLKECLKLKIYGQPSLGNYLVQWLKGMKPVEQTNKLRKVVIPSEWLVLQISYVLFISRYASMDLAKNGYQLLLRLGKRVTWWNAKCVWVAVSTVTYYMLFFTMLICFSLATGTLGLIPKSHIWIGEFHYAANRNCIVMTFVLPVLASFTIGLAQMLIELLSSAVIAVVLSSGYLLASAYWCNPMLLGNYSMFYRNSYFVGSKGVTTIGGIVICIVVSLGAYLAGRIYIKKYEF